MPRLTVSQLIEHMSKLPGDMEVWSYVLKNGKFTARPCTTVACNKNESPTGHAYVVCEPDEL